MKVAGRCIFCGNTGLTKEHLFADWLTELFPRTADDTHTHGKIITWEPTPKFLGECRQGHSGSRKVRKVCSTCNNGWISGIDSKAKEVSLPLIKGSFSSVTPEMQLHLATWFSKIAMVGDAIEPNRGVDLQHDRDWIRANLQPPPLWEVWIGSYLGTDWRDLAIFQHRGRFDLSEVVGIENFSGYVAATTIGIGDMIALVVSNENPVLPLCIGNAAKVLKRIWPISNTFNWPNEHILSDVEVSSISKILHTALVTPIKVS